MGDIINLTALLNSLKRLWWVPLLTLIAGALISADFVRRLPKIYRANTLILVEPQKIPTNYVKPIVTTPIENRLKTIHQQVTSRSRVEKIIEELDLFPHIRGKVPMEDLVARVNRGVQLEVRGTGTFRIYYEDRDPTIAASVANAVAGLFITENVNSRKAEANRTTSFLEAQLGMTKVELQRQERLIADFKRRHQENLPTRRDANFRMLEGLRDRLRTTMDAISKEEDRRILLQGQLADAISSGGASPQTTATQLDQLKRRLSELRGQYTEQHPEVTLLKRQISQMEESLAVEPPEPPTQAPARAAVSIREQQLRTQLAELDLRNRELQREADRLREEITEYERRVENAPQNEQEFLTLQRDYDILQQSYLELLRNKTQAEMAQNLEKESQGEQFVVLDRAVPPARPYKPNPMQIMTFGSAFGLFAGIALAFLFDIVRPRFRTEDELVAAYGIPVLVSIPAIATSEASPKIQWFRRLIVGTGILAALVVAAALFGLMAR